jgi:hypothetical protein
LSNSDAKHLSGELRGFQGFDAGSVGSIVAWFGILSVDFPQIRNFLWLDLVAMAVARKLPSPQVGRLTSPAKRDVAAYHGCWQSKNFAGFVAVHPSEINSYCLSSRR